MAVLLLSSLILLLLCSSTLGYSLTLLNASQMLSNSGYLSMSLTLQLISKTLNLDSPTATIFAPSDSAFVRSGQPSLNLFQYHVLPRRLSIETLKTLPKGTRIPTIVPKRSLIVTASPASSDGFISINGVKIDEKASFDDDSVIVYGIGDFFKPISKPAAQESSSGAKIGRKGGSIGEGSQVCGVQSFESVADFLRTRDYSIMAAFLDAQLTGFNSQMGLTIFAPVDEAIAEEHPKNISDFSLIFRQHVVPRLLPWKDLIGIDGGTKLQTFSRGFVVNVSVSDGVVLLNESPIVFQDLYQSDWLVVHGLSRLLTSPAEQDSMEDSFSDGYVGPDSHDYVSLFIRRPSFGIGHEFPQKLILPPEQYGFAILKHYPFSMEALLMKYDLVSEYPNGCLTGTGLRGQTPVCANSSVLKIERYTGSTTCSETILHRHKVKVKSETIISSSLCRPDETLNAGVYTLEEKVAKRFPQPIDLFVTNANTCWIDPNPIKPSQVMTADAEVEPTPRPRLGPRSTYKALLSQCFLYSAALAIVIYTFRSKPTYSSN
ncbi:hypothetical protein FEM48_Zijuj09G0220700 [Ziziphus jujuba var. spinosa]|uniref:FAS1 domain-containing protein n=1 Tax=Ziziphus jujuba var. spinosa TaxID=714518 RepID=A0A978UVK5_ZIZJJ|nr:hypothetical protein FEM48_Zijuj09G0220700 [Ziziphus jujuba var. spinosa]